MGQWRGSVLAVGGNDDRNDAVGSSGVLLKEAVENDGEKPGIPVVGAICEASPRHGPCSLPVHRSPLS
eukprot:116173-Chlamydomonas_euryale.AAC.1